MPQHREETTPREFFQVVLRTEHRGDDSRLLQLAAQVIRGLNETGRPRPWAARPLVPVGCNQDVAGARLAGRTLPKMFPYPRGNVAPMGNRFSVWPPHES